MRRQDKELLVENIINIALAQFEWHGLPETCDRLYFERALLNQGYLTKDYLIKAPYSFERRLKHETTR